MLSSEVQYNECSEVQQMNKLTFFLMKNKLLKSSYNQHVGGNWQLKLKNEASMQSNDMLV